MYISCFGLIGAGKTTLAERLSEKLNCALYREPVDKNPYLDAFYSDMPRYAFQMEMYLLNYRFTQQQRIVKGGGPVVQDRSFYEDAAFARLLHRDNIMNSWDFKTYEALTSTLTSILPPPDVILHLDVTPETAHARIMHRGRTCEQNMSIDYLVKLKEEYGRLLDDMAEKNIRVVTVDWNEFKSAEEVVQALM